MNYTFDTLKAEYEADLAAMKPTRSSEAVATAKALLVHRDRFLTLQQMSLVPALWIMPTFEREGPEFTAYFGNGDPLDEPTKDVPKGRGPFSTWELGALDALRLDHVTDPADWSWAYACWQWEKWNGFGSRNHGRPTGYVWAGTSIYRGGKYVADGEWSRGTWDTQLGTVILATTIAELDPEIGKGFVK